MGTQNGDWPLGWLTPWKATWGVAVLHAGVPLTVKLSAGATNPFLYNAVVKLAQMPGIVLVLLWLTQALFGHDIGTLKLLVKSPHCYLRCWGTPARPSSGPVSRALRMPLVWLAVCYFDYSLFAWSTHFVDPVVSATLLQMWPLSLMVLMVRARPYATNTHKMTTSGWWLAAVAAGGVVLVFASQGSGWDDLLGTGLTHTLAGMALALAAGLLAGAAPWATIVFGELLWASYSQQTDTVADSPELAAAQRLWFSLLGFLVALAASVVLNLLVGLSHAPAGRSMPMVSLVGSTVMGAVLLAPASVLIRKANYDSSESSVNSVLFVAPLLSVGLLLPFGVTIERWGLLAIGAAMILMVNFWARHRTVHLPETCGNSFS